MTSLTMPLLQVSKDRVLQATVLLLLCLFLIAPEQAQQSFEFLIQALLGIAPYILLAVTLAAAIKASGLDQSFAKVFAGHPAKSIVLAALFGALSPFCSCGVIPIIASLLAAGVPLAPVMAFWIASPVMDPEMFILTSAGISFDFAVAKALFAVALGLFAGFAAYLLQSQGYLTTVLRKQSTSDACGSSCASECGVQEQAIQLAFWQDPKRLAVFKQELIETLFFLGKWLALAFLLESLMLAYIEPDWVQTYIGGDTVWAIPMAALIGLPSYLNGYAAIPMVNGLMDLGMSPAAGMTFMLTGAVSSIPAAVAVFALVRKPVFLVYVILGLLGSVVCGYIYQLVL